MKWPGSPTMVLVTDSQTPRTNGYAMKSVSNPRVGKSSQKASVSSRSGIRLLRATAKLGARSGSRIHLAYLFGGPLHRFFSTRALHCLGIHVGDDVLRQHLGG